MNHPLATLPAKLRRSTFLTLLVITLTVMVALNMLGQPLRTDEAPAGIISYEFAGNVTTAQAILDSWDNQGKILAGFNLGLDYLFLIAYSTVIAMAILWVAERLALYGRRLTLFSLLAWALWLAALLDAVENASLFRMLVDGASDPWPQIAWWCAFIKFAIVFIGIAIVLAGALMSLVISRRRPLNT